MEEMTDRERFFALYRRIEAHRFAYEALVQNLLRQGSLNVVPLIYDLQLLERQMRAQNEDGSLIDEMHQLRLRIEEIRDEPEPDRWL